MVKFERIYSEKITAHSKSKHSASAPPSPFHGFLSSFSDVFDWGSLLGLRQDGILRWWVTLFRAFHCWVFTFFEFFLGVFLFEYLERNFDCLCDYLGFVCCIVLLPSLGGFRKNKKWSFHLSSFLLLFLMIRGILISNFDFGLLFLFSYGIWSCFEDVWSVGDLMAKIWAQVRP